MRIGKIKKAFSDFAKQAKNENQRGKAKERRKQIQEKLEELEIVANGSNFPCGAISDLEDGEFYGLRIDFRQKKKIQ